MRARVTVMTPMTAGATLPRMLMAERWRPRLLVQTQSEVLSTPKGVFLLRVIICQSQKMVSRFWSNVACDTPAPTTRRKASSSSPITYRERLEAGESLREGQCEYACEDTGGCTTELLVDWRRIVEGTEGW